MSVDQLAIVILAAVDNKVAMNGAYNWVEGKLAPYLATQHTMNIAPRSLRNKGSATAMENRYIEIAKDAVMAIYKMMCKY